MLLHRERRYMVAGPLAVDEPQINKAGNNQKAILCPEGQNKFCVRTGPVLTEHRVRLDGVLRGPHGAHALGGHGGASSRNAPVRAKKTR